VILSKLSDPDLRTGLKPMLISSHCSNVFDHYLENIKVFSALFFVYQTKLNFF